MKKLIEALNILLKYGNPDCPFHCEHDILYICGYAPDEISDEDKKSLEDLGFIFGDEGIYSYKYGSA